MARQGCNVDAVDISQEAINWGIERAKANNVEVNFVCNNIFDLKIEPKAYDFIYDCGCFHHILPHRRISFLDIVKKGLKPGGTFGLICFALGDMGTDMTDWEVYRQRSLKGGLGYTEEKIKAIFKDFEIVQSAHYLVNPFYGQRYSVRNKSHKTRVNRRDRRKPALSGHF